MTPLVIGVDPSLTATGIAWSDGRLTTVKYDKETVGDRRLDRIHIDVRDAAGFWTLHIPALAVIEDLPTHAHGAGKTGMAQGVVRLALIDAGCRYITVTPATVKKYATGKGNATKPDMRVALLQRGGLDVRDDNQVDAHWLRAIGMHIMGAPLYELPKTHTDALNVIEWDA